jgi:hypothetical protein
MIAIDARYSRSKNDASKWVRTVKSSSNITPIVERDVANASPSDTREVIGGNVPLRVLLIGDSILVGYASMDFNGFRQKLYDAFVNSGKYRYRRAQLHSHAHPSKAVHQSIS